jgi:hypothetical protein
MERVLALQALSESFDVDPAVGGSDISNECGQRSDVSSGPGHSSCSFSNCRAADEIDW